MCRSGRSSRRSTLSRSKGSSAAYAGAYICCEMTVGAREGHGKTDRGTSTCAVCVPVYTCPSKCPFAHALSRSVPRGPSSPHILIFLLSVPYLFPLFVPSIPQQARDRQCVHALCWVREPFTERPEHLRRVLLPGPPHVQRSAKRGRRGRLELPLPHRRCRTQGVAGKELRLRPAKLQSLQAVLEMQVSSISYYSHGQQGAYTNIRLLFFRCVLFSCLCLSSCGAF